MEPKRFFSKRVFLSLLGLGTATGLVIAGKIGGSEWVYALAVVIAGHHASDIVSAWKGK
jgi:hypothetical protein